jgi:hypothetical protein
MKTKMEDRKIHRMPNIHHCLEMWQGTQNLTSTPKKSQAQNKGMTALGYISDPEEIVKASWSLFQPDGVGMFKLSETSPLQPVWSGKDFPREQTQI